MAESVHVFHRPAARRSSSATTADLSSAAFSSMARSIGEWSANHATVDAFAKTSSVESAGQDHAMYWKLAARLSDFALTNGQHSKAAERAQTVKR